LGKRVMNRLKDYKPKVELSPGVDKE